LSRALKFALASSAFAAVPFVNTYGTVRSENGDDEALFIAAKFALTSSAIAIVPFVNTYGTVSVAFTLLAREAKFAFSSSASATAPLLKLYSTIAPTVSGNAKATSNRLATTLR
jgi:hypothetical protein